VWVPWIPPALSELPAEVVPSPQSIVALPSGQITPVTTVPLNA
jgi:hypothetical protein